ncbi:hypothetical protein SNE40_014289 [Patella caerulea]|uniref:Uncharacterized protein n=1 Tax=Patella caerulea TaxID=87958 RepID=A0AAN8JGP2_PATCE
MALELQKQKQQHQNVSISHCLSKNPVYGLGQLVYMFKPTSSILTAQSRKIKADWCGPYVIHQILDRTHYVLATLDGHVLPDVFSINRLKPCFVRAPNLNERITHIDQLQQKLGKASHTVNSVTCENALEFTDELNNVLSRSDSSHICNRVTIPVDTSLCLSHYAENHHLASVNALSSSQIEQQCNLLSQVPNIDHMYMVISKASFKQGQLHVLVGTPNAHGKCSYEWINVTSSPDLFNVTKTYIDENSPHREYRKILSSTAHLKSTILRIVVDNFVFITRYLLLFNCILSSFGIYKISR